MGNSRNSFDLLLLGLIFGIWNSHTSIGNILGSLIAGVFVEGNWAYSFIVPGAIMAFVGILLFCFLVVHPEDVGCQPTLETSVQVSRLWDMVMLAIL